MTTSTATEFSELRLATPYLTLAVRAWGPPDGVPVLALHGWLDNAASFDRLASRLPEWRLVALDLPGHGQSDWRPPGVHYHFVDFVPDVLLAADALNWTRFTLLGHSLGAAIACFVAAIAPERVERLLLIEGLGPLAGEAAAAPPQLALSMQQWLALSGKTPPRYASVEEAARLRQQAGDLSLAAATLLVERSLRQDEDGFRWRSDPKLIMKSPLYLTEEQIVAFLRAIQAPTLLIQGTTGYVVQRRHLAHRTEQVARLTVRTLTGGHHLHLDEPEPVAAALREFLATPAA
jgi:pimeloyl-ACP methyl ester carboxylesterase